jgi:hypothetical protein
MLRFFSYSPNGSGLEFHATAEEAQAEAESQLDEERDLAGEGWSEEVGSICWGEVRQRAVCTEVPAEEGATFEGEPIDHYESYNLTDFPAE